MNFTLYSAGPRQQLKSNGQTKVSKGYKRSRLDNLRGGAKNKALSPSAELSPAALALSPLLCVRKDGESTSEPHSKHNKMSRNAFEGEIDMEEEEDTGDEETPDRMAVVSPTTPPAVVPFCQPLVAQPIQPTLNAHANPHVPLNIAEHPPMQVAPAGAPADTHRAAHSHYDIYEFVRASTSRYAILRVMKCADFCR